MSPVHLPVRKKLGNGLTVVYLHTPTDPVSACHLFIPAGAAHENPRQSGIGSLTWSLLSKGTRTRTAKEQAEAVESIGASVSAGITHDYSEVSAHAIADYFPQALVFMQEALFHPAFRPQEVEKERGALLAAIRSKKESVFTLANEQLNQRLYGAHPYARPVAGTEPTVAKLNAAAVTAWHRKISVPVGSVMSLATSRPPSEMLPHIEKLFGPSAWPKRSAAGLATLRSTPAAAAGGTLKRVEPFEQAYLLVGYPAPLVSSKSYLALKVLNAVLGGGMSARLFQRLREQEGLAYDVGTFYPSKRFGSAFVGYMGLQESKIEQARTGMLECFQAVTDAAIPDAEIEQTKNYLKGGYILDHQTNSQRAHYLGWWEALGLGHEFDGGYLAGLSRVTPKDVLKAARAVLTRPPVIIEVRPKARNKAKAGAAR